MKPREALEQRRTLRGHEPAIRQLLGDVSEQSLMAGDHDVVGPAPGHRTQYAQLDRNEGCVMRGLVDECVHALDECMHDGCAVGVIVHEFGRHAPAIPEKPRTHIALEFTAAE